MKYLTLQRKIILITLLVSFTPLIFLGATIYYQFARMYKDKIEEQIKYRARAQAEAVDLFRPWPIPIASETWSKKKTFQRYLRS
jgi:sensor histidine kinase regulating citrate/malate metabolism